MKANNKSTSHPVPAECVTSYSDSKEEVREPATFCPHDSKLFIQILRECSDLNKSIEADAFKKRNNGKVEEATKDSAQRSAREQSSQNEENDATMAAKWPPVSINIIDSDNIQVCMCSQISVKDKTGSASVDGSICPECQNIIKRQPVEPRYRLISKRLMLTNNIIVNRIDTQHLSTYFDITHKRQDPYTPESAESHSPCPELSSSTTTSNDSRSPTADSRQLLKADSNKEDLQIVDFSDSHRKDIKGHGKSSELLANVANCDSTKTQQKGVVSPVQLKSRLEDLQKNSSAQSFKFQNIKDSDKAGSSDVEDVDDICPMTTNTAAQQNPNSCLPKCCNIH